METKGQGGAWLHNAVVLAVYLFLAYFLNR